MNKHDWLMSRDPVYAEAEYWAEIEDWITFSVERIRKGGLWTKECEDRRQKAKQAWAHLLPIGAEPGPTFAEPVQSDTSSWRPIESAPRDGVILLWFPDLTGQEAQFGYWHVYEDAPWCPGEWRDRDNSEEFIRGDDARVHPTHWAPAIEGPHNDR